MRAKILQAISLLIGLATLAMLLIDGSLGSEDMLKKVTYLATAATFIAFGLGGYKLLTKLPYLSLTAEKVGDIFTTGRSPNK